MRISDWSSDVCSSDLEERNHPRPAQALAHHDFACGINTVDLKHRLRNVQPDRRNLLHRSSPPAHPADHTAGSWRAVNVISWRLTARKRGLGKADIRKGSAPRLHSAGR